MIEYIDHPEFGRVRVSKRKGTRSMRLSITQTGEVRLSLPVRVGTQAGLAFIQEKREWLIRHNKEEFLVENGALLGKDQYLHVVPTYKAKSRAVYQNDAVTLFMPDNAGLDYVNSRINQTVKHALLLQAKRLLPERVATYAAEHGFVYRSLSMKPLQSRWGSCSSTNDLVLNTYLIQLPWQLIDYVIVHELAHTKHHHHKATFWEEVSRVLPDYKKRRQLLKKFPTQAFDVRDIARFMS